MILIIDDDAVVRSSLTFLLKRAGHTPVAVGSPKEAISAVREKDFRLVLMDMNYSLTTTGEEGLHLLRQVKALRGGNKKSLFPSSSGSHRIPFRSYRTGSSQGNHPGGCFCRTGRQTPVPVIKEVFYGYYYNFMGEMGRISKRFL